MSHILLKIITPLGIIFERKVSEVSVPTVSGVVTILPQHIPLISQVRAGELLVREGNTATPFAVFSGVLEVREYQKGETECILLVDRSEVATDIDIEKAEAAYERAKMAMTEKKEDDVDFARFESLMEKELNRARVGRKWRG